MTKRSFVCAVGVACILLTEGCGSGACRQSPCVPGVPLLSGTCKCVPNEEGGPPPDATSADGGAD